MQPYKPGRSVSLRIPGLSLPPLFQAPDVFAPLRSMQETISQLLSPLDAMTKAFRDYAASPDGQVASAMADVSENGLDRARLETIASAIRYPSTVEGLTDVTFAVGGLVKSGAWDELYVDEALVVVRAHVRRERKRRRALRDRRRERHGRDGRFVMESLDREPGSLVDEGRRLETRMMTSVIVQTLSPRLREFLGLALRGHDDEEIAAAMGCRPSTVRVFRHQARRALAEILSQ